MLAHLKDALTLLPFVLLLAAMLGLWLHRRNCSGLRVERDRL